MLHYFVHAIFTIFFQWRYLYSLCKLNTQQDRFILLFHNKQLKKHIEHELQQKQKHETTSSNNPEVIPATAENEQDEMVKQWKQQKLEQQQKMQQQYQQVEQEEYEEDDDDSNNNATNDGNEQTLHFIFIPADDYKTQLKQVIDYLKLEYEEESIFSRCLKCNTEVLPVVDKETIRHLVFPKIFERHEKFFQCHGCNALYYSAKQHQTAKNFAKLHAYKEVQQQPEIPNNSK